MADGRLPRRSRRIPGRDVESRPGAAPLRGVVRPSATPPQFPDQPKPARPRLAPGLGVTQRALALVVVFAFLALSYLGSLSIYFDQEQQMAVARHDIARDQAAINRLNDEISRWQDPEYVKAQARDRLGYVLPGEVGYRVVAPDGTVIGGQVGSIAGRNDPVNQTWYERLQGSVQTADQPAPAPPSPQASQTITVPSPGSSKR